MFRGLKGMKICNDKTLLELVFFDKNEFYFSQTFFYHSCMIFNFFAKSKKCSRQYHSSSLREDVTWREK